MKKIAPFLIIFFLIIFAVLDSNQFNKKKKKDLIEQKIDQTASWLIKNWYADEALKEWRPPQVLTVPPGTKVYGGCGDYVRGEKVSGSYYCGASYSIVLDHSQIKYFFEEFGPSSIAKIIAHEFSHAVQDVEEIRLKEPMHELQADCMAGILVSKGSEELGITREGLIEMARFAHHIGGGNTHGSGDQRVYALLSGMGIASGTCDASQMEALANNKIIDPIYLQIKNIRKTRSASSELDLKQTPYPKSFNMVVNRIKRLEREK